MVETTGEEGFEDILEELWAIGIEDDNLDELELIGADELTFVEDGMIDTEVEDLEELEE